MPSVIKKVKADVAYELYVDHFPLKYKVSNKFRDDHTLDAPNLSKQTSIEAAIDRYKRNQNVKKSSWLLLDDKTLINKAKSANKGTDVHQGKQQITMQLVVTRRTVTIERLEKKDLARVKYEEVKIGNDTHYLNCVSDEKSVKINVMGGWSPLTGDVELYHYDENSFKDSHNISAKYLDWTYDEKEKKYIAPAAKN